MILTKARITNFRSIPKHYEISFSPRCRILVGINEAGKSNILKALSLLNKKEDFSPTDIRTPSKSDPQV
ncbi:MAG: AAA family ATPase, partial [Nanoarchaeota archaeon]|nr:AAA family ATPase [Nanoarchaeota archaeon]